MHGSSVSVAEAVVPVNERVGEQLDVAIERLKELLRIPSISTDPAYAADTRRAAEWCCNQLAEIGFEASVRDTPQHPMVVAHHPGPEGAPRLLYYGHYDVQPPDPMDEWHSTPFEPVIMDSDHGKKIVARGAVDDKGQLMTFIEAFRAWKSVHGTLPVNLTVFLEGEEESGSPSLEGFLHEHGSELAADACVICDTGQWDIDTPAITYMLRGLLYIQATLHGPGHDLHSGMYGGAVVNPITELARIVGALHDADGVVQIPGFYDDVRELSDAEKAQWKSLGFDDAKFLASAGVKTPVGERGYDTLQRTWSRPTCELNGIWGGYTGAGAKTVIPAHASAKISCRLVADQDPEAILAGLTTFLESRTPPDCRWEITSFGGEPAFRVPTESKFLEAAMEGLRRTYQRDPVLIGSGGSIPVAGALQQELGLECLLVGFGLDDDRVHSPNEKFELRCFEMGIRSHVAILERFGALGNG